MIKNIGKVSSDLVDPTFIPVNIKIEKVSDGFILCADVYMPGKSKILPKAIMIFSDNEYELKKIVMDKFLPLYKWALAKINGIIEGEINEFCYWGE